MYTWGNDGNKCKRCVTCRIDFPYGAVEGTICPGCEKQLGVVFGTPGHQDWEDRLSRANFFSGQWPSEDPQGNIIKLDTGQLVITGEDLKKAGYSEYQSSFRVLKLNGKYYEVQGKAAVRDEYWIIEIEIDPDSFYAEIEEELKGAK